MNKKIINVKNKGGDLKKNTDHNRVRELQYYLAVQLNCRYLYLIC